MEEKDAVDDFLARRANYAKHYEPVDEDDGVPYCKIVNSHKYIVHNIRGYLSLKIVHFVMNLHTLPRTFYFTRHGQSEYNLLGKIGGDSGLTPAGLEYARRLAHFAKEEIARPRLKDTKRRSNSHDFLSDEKDDELEGGENSNSNSNEDNEERPCRLWTSTMRRTQETAQFISHTKFNHTFDNGECFDWLQFRPKPRRNLDELYAGTCDGMTYKEIQDTYPDEFARRQADKLSYRYPRGESYMDVTLRLEPLAQEMERIREPLLIVGHQGILRILYAYFMGLDRKEAPYVSIPLNNVIELTPHAYGCHEKRYCLMMKEEMLVDGQDEPITSMPMAKRGLMAPGLFDVNGGGANNNNNDGANNNDDGANNNNDANNNNGANNGYVSPNAIPSLTLKRGTSVQEIDAEYSKDDPIMNAPSC
jgi:broad specificity phosphatase PhoE